MAAIPLLDAIVNIKRQQAQTTQQIANMQSQLGNLTTQEATATKAYLASSAMANEQFEYNGHLFDVTNGVMTVTNPQAVKTPIQILPTPGAAK
jgi:hypothetical protein